MPWRRRAKVTPVKDEQEATLAEWPFPKQERTHITDAVSNYSNKHFELVCISKVGSGSHVERPCGSEAGSNNHFE